MENKEYHETIKDKKEEDALNQLKNILATTTEKKDKMVITPDVLLNDDLLLHFLRARKNVPKKAVKMIIEYLHWKCKVNLDDIYNNFKLEKKYLLESYFPHGLHKVTKNGNPIYIQIIGLLKPEELFKEIPPNDLITYSTQIYERLERDLYRICSVESGKYIHGVYNIMDFKGISKTILNKKLLGYLKENLKLCQDYFPECLEGCFVLNAGMVFRALYSACKVFLDSKTKQKIKVYGPNYQQALLGFIDKENLPTFLGGVCQCEGGCMFSNAGPWNKEGNNSEGIPQEVLNRRKEITDILMQGKLKTHVDDEVKDPKQVVNGVSGEDFK